MERSLNFEDSLQMYLRTFGYSEDLPDNIKSSIEIKARAEAASYQALSVSDSLLDWCTQPLLLTQRLKSNKAQHYMLYGVGRRFSMLFHAYRSIIGTASPLRNSPLTTEETHDLCRDINVVYINLLGALDNFAWSLLFEMHHDEGDCPKNLIGLFSKKYRQLLTAFPFDLLEEFDDWHTEVKTRRDPAAHRIPLTIPPSIVNPDEAKRHVELQKLHLNATVTSNFSQAQDIMDEINRIGTFNPLIAHHPTENPTELYPTVSIDLANLIKISTIVRDNIIH